MWYIVTAPTLELVYLYNIVRYSAAAVACGGRAGGCCVLVSAFPVASPAAAVARRACRDRDCSGSDRYSMSGEILVCPLASVFCLTDLPDCRGIPGKSPLGGGLQTLADRALPREVTLPRGEGWRGRARTQLARPTSTQAPPQSQRSTLQIHVRKAGRKRGE